MTVVGDPGEGSGGARRGVTRGYVYGLIGAAVFLAGSLIVFVWGMLALATDSLPIVTPGVPTPVGLILVVLGLAALGWGMWHQALALLRGRREAHLGLIVAEAFGGYLIWCLGGMLAGLSFSETWLSAYAWLIVPIFAVAAFAFWAVLARRVYTDKSVPRWPWEQRGEPGPGLGPHDGGDPPR